MPGEQLAPEQEQAAGEERQVDQFHTASADRAEGSALRHQLVHGQALVGADGVEHCGADPGIRLLRGDAEDLAETFEQAEAGVRTGPAGHFQREGHQHHHIAKHRRVERVLPEPAVQVLAEDQGEAGGDQRQPPGRVGRQGEGE
ncbi:hypothetical protein D3C81_1069390 [compost metagenome]